jgi:hypothetical protein
MASLLATDLFSCGIRHGRRSTWKIYIFFFKFILGLCNNTFLRLSWQQFRGMKKLRIWRKITRSRKSFVTFSSAAWDMFLAFSFPSWMQRRINLITINLLWRFLLLLLTHVRILRIRLLYLHILLMRLIQLRNLLKRSFSWVLPRNHNKYAVFSYSITLNLIRRFLLLRILLVRLIPLRILLLRLIHLRILLLRLIHLRILLVRLILPISLLNLEYTERNLNFQQSL